MDPVEGGTENSYIYPTDPVNEFDLTGEFSFKVLGKVALKAAHVAQFVPGPIGMAATGVAVGVQLASGNYAAAAMEATGFIPGGKLMAGGIKAVKVAKGVANTRRLSNGAVRSYGKLRTAKTKGEMAGARKVTEVKNGNKRSWYETLDSKGRVRQVRPFDGKGYRHYTFDSKGKYTGRW